MSGIGSAFKVAEKVVTVLGGVAAAATVVDVVGQKTGLTKPGEGVLRTVAGGVVGAGLQLAGAPTTNRPTALAGSQPAALPPVPSRRTVCPMCQSGPVLAGVAGEEITISACDEHSTQAERNAAGIDAMYTAWAQSRGIDIGAASKCGPKPLLSQYKGNFSVFQGILINWQACVQAERDAADKAKADKAALDKALAEAKKAGYASGKKIQQDIAKYSLEKVKKDYEQQISDIQAAQMQAKTDEQKAALQTQIDAANAAKAAAEKALADSQAQARDAQHKAEIDALQAQIAAAAKQPGGMDQFVQQFMLQQMMQQPQQQAAPMVPASAFGQPAMMAPEGSLLVAAQPGLPMFAPQQQMYAQPMVAPQMMMVDEGSYGYGDPFAGFDFAGAPPETPAPKELVSALELPTATATLGEVRELFDWRQRDGLSNEELEALLSASRSVESGTTCYTGACGIR